MSAPTERQLNTIRMIEGNLPKLRFFGSTFDEAKQFISTHIAHSKQARRGMWDAINKEERNTPCAFFEDGKGHNIFQDSLNKEETE